ncbi:MAG: bifunctional chorismate mutase/prephenate dehydratase [Clostridiales bacterium]|nr:bifunctional chorismate mutase/prephenate dehydratase [Clostridiales bacterium]
MNLDDIRVQIDDIDGQLIDLFTRRMNAVRDVARYKAEHGLPVLDRSRERAVLMKVSEQAGPELRQYAKILYGALFDVSRSYQRGALGVSSPLTDQIRRALDHTPAAFPARATVACQGAEGAYSQQACDRLFQFSNLLYFNSFDAVFSAVERGMCQYGILPIENSLAGTVTPVYDLMESHRFHIARCVRQRVDHALLGLPGSRMGEIREVRSHPQAISQCGDFLQSRPGVVVVECENTAVAAQAVAQSGRNDVAAIASRSCAELYGLTVLSDSVANNPNNVTRFICISKELEIYPGANKVSLRMSLQHRPGSLYEMLSRLAVMGLNLTKLESRPIPGKDFEFRFHFDLEASVAEPEVLGLMGDLASSVDSFTFLGNYAEV